MRGWVVAFVVGCAAGAATVAWLERDESGADSGRVRGAVVERVVDGDTVELADGTRVRLVQIDAPERGEECYAAEAAAALARLLPEGSRVRLESDPALDEADRFGRALRYVFRGDTNVNVELVRDGAATVWFFEGAEGRYADTLVAEARDARRERRGLWGACPQARFDPDEPADTGGS